MCYRQLVKPPMPPPSAPEEVQTLLRRGGLAELNCVLPEALSFVAAGVRGAQPRSAVGPPTELRRLSEVEEGPFGKCADVVLWEGGEL